MVGNCCRRRHSIRAQVLPSGRKHADGRLAGITVCDPKCMFRPGALRLCSRGKKRQIVTRSYCFLGLGRYRCGARYPILSAPDDTDTGCDVIAPCGLTDELSKIFFPCKGLWSSNNVLCQNNKTVYQ
jgi:hypothetical protein